MNTSIGSARYRRADTKELFCEAVEVMGGGTKVLVWGGEGLTSPSTGCEPGQWRLVRERRGSGQAAEHPTARCRYL